LNFKKFERALYKNKVKISLKPLQLSQTLKMNSSLKNAETPEFKQLIKILNYYKMDNPNPAIENFVEYLKECLTEYLNAPQACMFKITNGVSYKNVVFKGNSYNINIDDNYEVSYVKREIIKKVINHEENIETNETSFYDDSYAPIKNNSWDGIKLKSTFENSPIFTVPENIVKKPVKIVKKNPSEWHNGLKSIRHNLRLFQEECKNTSINKYDIYNMVLFESFLRCHNMLDNIDTMDKPFPLNVGNKTMLVTIKNKNFSYEEQKKAESQKNDDNNVKHVVKSQKDEYDIQKDEYDIQKDDDNNVKHVAEPHKEINSDINQTPKKKCVIKKPLNWATATNDDSDEDDIYEDDKIDVQEDVKIDVQKDVKINIHEDVKNDVQEDINNSDLIDDSKSFILSDNKHVLVNIKMKNTDKSNILLKRLLSVFHDDEEIVSLKSGMVENVELSKTVFYKMIVIKTNENLLARISSVLNTDEEIETIIRGPCVISPTLGLINSK
jgi:hypothetical protein